MVLLGGALWLSACERSDDDGVLRNGYVRLQLGSDALPAAVPDTMTVVATLRYGECLTQFYAANPAMRQQGERGAKDFADRDAGGEGWQDRLCDGDVAAAADCEVLAIDQQLGGPDQLTITYAVEHVVDNSELLFGPLPTAATAKCAAGELPTVQVASSESVRGEDASGTVIWHAYTFDPSKVATGPSSVIKIHPGPAD
ncbi:MAG TPA: hypothetical protein VG755_05375 [Nannocystaceae bacterium]|nr:hypothetical protein [Nannocystaceae bacterium]